MTDFAESPLDSLGKPESMLTQLVPDGLPKITKFSDIKIKTLEWLWPGRIPLGKLTVLAGDPGLGKSLITVAIATALTEEAKWPDCNEYALGGSVVLLSAEDDEGDTIKPRLMAAGADPEKVYSMDSIIDLGDRKRGFSLDCDIEKLSNVLKTVPDCRLLVIDPISAFMGKVDSHNVADVRAWIEDGHVKTIAGNGLRPGPSDPTGDGGAATDDDTFLAGISAVASDSQGNTYIASENA